MYLICDPCTLPVYKGVPFFLSIKLITYKDIYIYIFCLSYLNYKCLILKHTRAHLSIYIPLIPWKSSSKIQIQRYEFSKFSSQSILCFLVLFFFFFYWYVANTFSVSYTHDLTFHAITMGEGSATWAIAHRWKKEKNKKQKREGNFAH